jgi:hypothetical protein
MKGVYASFCVRWLGMKGAKKGHWENLGFPRQTGCSRTAWLEQKSLVCRSQRRWPLGHQSFSGTIFSLTKPMPRIRSSSPIPSCFGEMGEGISIFMIRD